MLSLLKLIKLTAVIGFFLIHHSFIFILHKNKSKRGRLLAQSTSNYCKVFCKILNIKITSELKPEDVSKKLILSNHMSYVDIFCLSSLYPTLYVTSVEIKETPVLGQICQLAACLFTERRRKKRTQNTLNDEIKSIQAYLNEGISITIFPEGTSTDGTQILPFKTALIQSSIGGDTHIAPLVIRYENPFKVCWYGDMTFFPHLLELIKVPEIKATIFKAPDILAADLSDRKDVAIKAHKIISEIYFNEA